VQDLLHCAYCRSLSKHAKPGSLQHRLSWQLPHLAEQDGTVVSGMLACVVVVGVGGLVVEVVVALVVLAACVVIGVVVG